MRELEKLDVLEEETIFPSSTFSITVMTFVLEVVEVTLVVELVVLTLQKKKQILIVHI